MLIVNSTRVTAYGHKHKLQFIAVSIQQHLPRQSHGQHPFHSYFTVTSVLTERPGYYHHTKRSVSNHTKPASQIVLLQQPDTRLRLPCVYTHCILAHP